MRVVVHTASGSVYGLDSGAMTWTRVNVYDERDVIPTDGKLTSWPTLEVGKRFRFEDSVEGWFITTPIVLAELVSDPYDV